MGNLSEKCSQHGYGHTFAYVCESYPYITVTTLLLRTEQLLLQCLINNDYKSNFQEFVL